MNFLHIISLLIALTLGYSPAQYFDTGATAKTAPSTGCPLGSNYINPVTGASVTLASLGVTGPCYYISASGSDSNNGLTESTPWLHAPGMSACSLQCAAVTPGPGKGFIFRGGDTWHFGNSALSPYVGAGNPGFNILQSGTSGAPIYRGVDRSWFSGASWNRPIFSGDNPFSNSSVSSCPHDESTYTAFSWQSKSYEYFDSLDISGFCWHGNQSNANEGICCLQHMAGAQGSATPSNNVIQNVYIHGWSHVTFSCSTSGGEPTGNCDGGKGIDLGSNQAFNQGDTLSRIVIDGADTDKSSLCAICFAAYDLHESVIRNLANGIVTNNTHVLYGNLVELLLASSDGVSHTNGFHLTAEWNGVNAIYGNVLRSLWLTAACEVTQWETPSTTDYYFNNSVYGMGCNGNFYDLAPGGGGWTAIGFNNFWQVPNSGAVNANPAGTTVNWSNNQCMIPGGTTLANCYAGAGTLVPTTNFVGDPTTYAACYTSGSTPPFFPQSGSCPTVGTGTNRQSYCSALIGSSDPLIQAAGRACQNTTGFACSYSTVTHSVACPDVTIVARPTSTAWDIGTYQQ